MRWRISIAIYAHSTGNGAEADKKAAGADEGDIYFYVDAQDFKEASKMAQCFSDGVRANPAVWEAPIMGVHRYEEGIETGHKRDRHVREMALKAAAGIARNGCLVPPDGGSPPDAEAEMCDHIADAILKLIPA